MKIHELKDLIDYCESKDFIYYNIETKDKKLVFIKDGFDTNIFKDETEGVISQVAATKEAKEFHNNVERQEKEIIENKKNESIKSKNLNINISDKELMEIRSPYVGIITFPDKIKDGDHKVKKDDVICSIEAMKVYNDINCPISGQIKEIYVEDNELVEYDQLIMEIEVKK